MSRIHRLGALCVLISLPAWSADWGGKARLSAGAGFDTNVRRDYQQVGTAADLMATVVGSVEGSGAGDRWQLSGAYDGGVRGFLFYPREDVLVQALDAEASWLLGRYVGVGTMGRARDRRGGERDYTDLGAQAFVDFVPDPQLDVRAWGGGHRFVYWPVFAYSFRASEFGATAKYRLDRRHSLLAFGEAGFRTYNANARDVPNDPTPSAPHPREDSVFNVGAGYAYRGPFAVTVTYAYQDQESNSYGETTRRHRLTATGGVKLPWKLFLFVQASLQLSEYPDGINQSPEVILDEDAENHNSLSLKLARPLSEHFDVEARWALYQNRLPGNHLDYLRQIGWLGITWRY